MTEYFSDILTVFDAGLRMKVRAKPGSSRTRVPKIVELGEGRRAIEIAVAAVAEDGKANKAILDSLAQEIGLPKKALSIMTGTNSRLKLIEIDGDPKALKAKVMGWLKKL